MTSILSAHKVGFLRTECSQITRTSHPKALSSFEFRRSLLLLALSFRIQNSVFDFGGEQCLGQKCQKHPLTKTASLSFGKTKSGLTEPEGIMIFKCLLQPAIPRERIALTIGNSVVPLPFERIEDMIWDRFSGVTVSMDSFRRKPSNH